LDRHILVVDDEQMVRESLELLLGRLYTVTAAADAEIALDCLQSKTRFDLVLVDLMMPGIDGLTLLQRLKHTHPSLPVIMLTASSEIQSAVEAIKSGAADYLRKPYDVDDLLLKIESALKEKKQIVHRFERPGLKSVSGDFGALIGRNPRMKQIFDQVDQIAPRDVTVLVSGESGSGKELIAREIHARSNRKTGPFIALNCAAIPEAQVEYELFGHLAGALPGMPSARIGQFELADGGTLFLDEVGELSAAVQSRILRFLSAQEFFKVGSSEPTTVSVRVIAATNENLEEAVEKGTFRKDLFYRLNVVSLTCPPLRDRVEDLEALFSHFVAKFSPIYSREISLSPDAKSVLEKYQWPGNVRELENLVESLLALSPRVEIAVEDLPERIRREAGGELRGDVLSGKIGFEAAEKAFETELILKALQRTNWVQTKAAEMLGISRRILKYKMDKLGISDQGSSAEGEHS
jgi:two-component system response regulator AtoC